MTKQEVIASARRYGYRASYSAKLHRWFFHCDKPTGNLPAFDAIVFANMKRELGIE